MIPTPLEIAAWTATDAAWMARDGAIPETYTEDDGSLFPDGTRAVECTNWARYVRRAHGARAKLYGFHCEDNPTATGMERLAGGHDFAVLDDRYIIDGWLASVESELTDPVLDMHDPALAETILTFYGKPECWTHMTDLEALIDGEPGAIRQTAMEGVRPTAAEQRVSEEMEP